MPSRADDLTELPLRLGRRNRDDLANDLVAGNTGIFHAKQAGLYDLVAVTAATSDLIETM
jgi:hypothetical protein